MACENPYYDCSDCDNGSGGGGSVDLSAYAKKTEVKDYDQVKPLSSQTNETDVIYIDTNATIWLFDGTNYVKAGNGDDIQNIPISRSGNQENIPPETSELLNIPIFTNSIATIHLVDGIVEVWQYNGTIWDKKVKINRTTRVFHVWREGMVEDQEPEVWELERYTAIDGDTAIITFYWDDDTLQFLEFWSYNGGWNKTKKIDIESKAKVLELSNQDYTISKTLKSNVFPTRATSQDVVITLPLAEVMNKPYTIKADETTDPFIIFVVPKVTETIDNSLSPVELKSGDFVTVVSDGDEWHIVAKDIAPTTRPTEYITIHRETPTKDIAPTTAEFGFSPIDGDKATIILSENDIFKGVEKWEYSGGWSKTDETNSASGGETTEITFKNTYGMIKTINGQNSITVPKGSIVTVKIDSPTSLVSSVDSTDVEILNEKLGYVTIFTNSSYPSAKTFVIDGTYNYGDWHLSAKPTGGTADGYLLGGGSTFFAGQSENATDGSKAEIVDRYIQRENNRQDIKQSYLGIGGSIAIHISSADHHIQHGFNCNNKSFCVGGWFSIAQTQNESYILGNKNAGAYKQLHFGWHNASHLKMSFGGDALMWAVDSEYNLINAKNKWMHLFFTFNKDNKMGRLYVDGVHRTNKTFGDVYQSDISTLGSAFSFSRATMCLVSNFRVLIADGGEILNSGMIGQIYEAEKTKIIGKKVKD